MTELLLISKLVEARELSDMLLFLEVAPSSLSMNSSLAGAVDVVLFMLISCLDML